MKTPAQRSAAAKKANQSARDDWKRHRTK